ncbi:MAG: arginine decarboxylase, pyruvoyl-dependent [Candidatus Saccharicenans sp.]|jgi:arginine decarboxylase|nr:arginine decarboxylase, pyruvoyl-dependent [Candidatus Saccharicenans sp.]HOJ26717.1 arginine decarboxylase, pyruvoyl-dependent [Candidatus Saccharicenans sp.]HOL45765.1 arginine decarboxylase, pyruvoyl-dependent [Candidatus Saccharicenans sp.]HPP24134.1 arginine decarboxylase, pyruvoyl-dependent [Candidatus Saccharicenans sp.]
MDVILPKQVFLTRGHGQHREKLVSFELALREAGISPFNLVRVSSIFPPHCQLISRASGLKQLRAGQIVFLVMSENSTDEAHRLISSAIGLAIPEDPDQYGYLAEHEGFGETEKEASLRAEELAAEMLATKLGQDYSPKNFKRGKNNYYSLNDRLTVQTRSLSQIATGSKGLWTTTVAAAVLVT